MKTVCYFILLCLSMWQTMSAQEILPNREFRGAWIQMINGQFQGMSRDAMQANLTNQLNVMHRCGVNTVIFQVRGWLL
mgnify:FL=1